MWIIRRVKQSTIYVLWKKIDHQRLVLNYVEPYLVMKQLVVKKSVNSWIHQWVFMWINIKFKSFILKKFSFGKGSLKNNLEFSRFGLIPNPHDDENLKKKNHSKMILGNFKHIWKNYFITHKLSQHYVFSSEIWWAWGDDSNDVSHLSMWA